MTSNHRVPQRGFLSDRFSRFHFPDGDKESDRPIQSTVDAMREFAAGHDHKQPGDPKKLFKAIVVLVDSPKPCCPEH